MVGRLGAKENVAELMEISKGEKNNSVRYNLIEAIGNSKSDTAIPFLPDFFHNDVSPGSNLIQMRFAEAVTEGTNVLMAASKNLPPLIRTQLTLSASVINTETGNIIFFKIIKNRTAAVRLRQTPRTPRESLRWIFLTYIRRGCCAHIWLHRRRKRRWLRCWGCGF